MLKVMAESVESIELTEPGEFSDSMDPPERNAGKTSPYQRMKAKAKEKISKKVEKITLKINEDLEDNKSLTSEARQVTHDLVEPETLERLRNMIVEKPEIEPGCDYWLWFNIIRKMITWILMKFVDIGTDFGAAYQHFKRGDIKYGILTLFFVYLPGLVLALGFTYWGLFFKRDEGRIKKITCKRLGKYLLGLLIFPLLYPIVQILLGIVLVALLIRRRDHEPLKFMGHDLKQFKSMEGFLESGPQFALQSYILLIGQRKDTNINWNDITEDDAERLAMLSFSILMSYLSLVKTAYQVNVPDPDPRRRQQQDKRSSKWRFKITNWLFNSFTVLFRILSLSYFFVYLRQYTLILIFSAYLSNIIVISSIGASATIVFILGAISIFVPNGYLLHNFAGTLVVDFTRCGSQIFFFCSSFIVNAIWMLGIGSVLGLAQHSHLPKEQIIGDVDQYHFVKVMSILLFSLGVISSILALIHWYVSIERLFEPPKDDIPYIDEEDDPKGRLDFLDD